MKVGEDGTNDEKVVLFLTRQTKVLEKYTLKSNKTSKLVLNDYLIRCDIRITFLSGGCKRLF